MLKKFIAISILLFVFRDKFKFQPDVDNPVEIDIPLSIANKFVNNAIINFNVSGDQISNIYRIVDYFYASGNTNINQLAYILGTAWHESFFKPIKEIRANSGTTLYNTQNVYWSSGYYGRGFVQLTFLKNYEKMSEITGIDLVNNPDLVLNPDISTVIIVEGMIRGTFTGKSLNNYINDLRIDFEGARRVVNGLDKSNLIAVHTRKLLKNILL